MFEIGPRGENFYFLYYQWILLIEPEIGLIGNEKNEDPKSSKCVVRFPKPDPLVPRYTVLFLKKIVSADRSSVL